MAKAHLERIEEATPTLKEKLVDARQKWEASFWKLSGLKSKKAEADIEPDDASPLYFGDENQPLTPEQAAALKQVVEQLNPDGWSQALYDEMTVLVAAGYISAKEILQAAGYVTTDFDAVPSLTLEAIRKKAEQFAFMVNQREQQAMFDVIDAAIAQGQTPKELAGVIADTFAEGYHVTTPSEGVVKRIPTDTWSQMVARTELSRAQTMGTMALYRAAGIEKVMWVTSQGANVCDECEPLDGQIFDLGDVDDPPIHPCCVCSLAAADEDVAYSEAS